jgi:choline dehydrogenase-like flavoprotein
MLITGPNLDDPIDFDVGYFTDKEGVDIKKHMWAYKRLRALVRSTELYRGEVGISHPEFPEGSKAACVTDTDSKSVVREPEYTAEDDEAIEKFIRANVATTWHSMGTCKMAAEEQGGVVDANLNVYGVQGLKCVDLSIAQQIAANTNNTAFVIGEKGADIIIRELGLK